MMLCGEWQWPCAGDDFRNADMSFCPQVSQSFAENLKVVEVLAIKCNGDWCIIMILSEIGNCSLKYVHQQFPDVRFSRVLLNRNLFLREHIFEISMSIEWEYMILPTRFHL